MVDEFGFQLGAVVIDPVEKQNLPRLESLVNQIVNDSRRQLRFLDFISHGHPYRSYPCMSGRYRVIVAAVSLDEPIGCIENLSRRSVVSDQIKLPGIRVDVGEPFDLIVDRRP